MFPYYRGYSKNIKLHTDDITAIRKLYGGKTQLEQQPDTDFFFADPPPEVSAPSASDLDDAANSDGMNSTEIASTNTPIRSSASSSTLETSTTTITTAINPLTPLLSINEAQIQDEQAAKATISSTVTATTTTTTAMSSRSISYSYRSKSRYTSRSPSLKSTSHWLHSYHETHSSTAKTNVSYADRSKLDLCDGFYDAITMYKGILFIFKGQVSRSSSSLRRRHDLLSLSLSQVFLAIWSTWSRSILADDQQCLLVRSTRDSRQGRCSLRKSRRPVDAFLRSVHRKNGDRSTERSFRPSILDLRRQSYLNRRRRTRLSEKSKFIGSSNTRGSDRCSFSLVVQSSGVSCLGQSLLGLGRKMESCQYIRLSERYDHVARHRHTSRWCLCWFNG